MDSEILKRQWRVIPAAYLSGFESKLPQQLRAIDRLEALPTQHPHEWQGFLFLGAFGFGHATPPLESLEAVLLYWSGSP